MSDDDNIAKGERVPLLIADHRVTVLVSVAILVSLVLTGFSLALYDISGTAQLDLSRPSYAGVGEMIQQDRGSYVEYSASGPINEGALREFDELYTQQVDNITSIDAFGGDPLAPEALGISSEEP